MAHLKLWMINLLKKAVQFPKGCKEQIWIKRTKTGDVSKLGIGHMSFGYGLITKHDIDVWSFSWFDSWSSFFGSIFGYIEYLHHSHAWDVHGTIFCDKWEDTVYCIYQLIWYRLMVSARSVFQGRWSHSANDLVSKNPLAISRETMAQRDGSMIIMMAPGL